MKKLMGVMAALLCLVAAGRVAYAADNGTEFGIEDDITVLGMEGTALDPDAEIKGFTVFGATQAAYTGAEVGAGNVVVNGQLAVSSGAYFVGGSTFSTGGAYFTGVSSFSDVANVHYGGGAAGQVLKKVAGGGMQWANDSDTAMTFQTPYRVQMVNGTDDDLADSLFLQNSGGSNITMISGSSLTVTGAFGVDGVTSLNGLINLGDEAADLVTMLGPLTVMGTSSITVQGALEVDGAAKLDGDVALGDAAADFLTVNAQASFVSGSTFTAGAYFQSISSFSNVANLHIAGGAANQVLKKVSGGGMQWADDLSGAGSVTGTPNRIQKIDNSGTGLVDSAFVQSGNGDAANLTMMGSSLTVTSVTLFKSSVSIQGDASGVGLAVATGKSTSLGGTLGVNGDADLDAKLNVDGTSTFVSSMTAKGDTQFGDATDDLHSVNRAVEAGVALSVDSGGASGNYAAKFYSGGSLAAWIKKK